MRRNQHAESSSGERTVTRRVDCKIANKPATFPTGISHGSHLRLESADRAGNMKGKPRRDADQLRSLHDACTLARRAGQRNDRRATILHCRRRAAVPSHFTVDGSSE